MNSTVNAKTRGLLVLQLQKREHARNALLGALEELRRCSLDSAASLSNEALCSLAGLKSTVALKKTWNNDILAALEALRSKKPRVKKQLAQMHHFSASTGNVDVVCASCADLRALLILRNAEVEQLKHDVQKLEVLLRRLRALNGDQ